MAIADVLASIDSEIAKLREARALLGGSVATTQKKKAGRPRKAVAASQKAVAFVAPSATKSARKKRKLSPEGRKRIAEAVKKRWAAQKAAAAK